MFIEQTLYYVTISILVFAMNANEVEEKNNKNELHVKTEKRRSPWRVFTDTNKLFLETIKFMFR